MRSKAQSAMEYLMTYGWAILIIAVILIGLNYLGVFNSETFAPKASPGACYVLRTAAQVSLAGECNGYIPRSVAQLTSSTGTSVASSPSLSISKSVSVTGWFYETSLSQTQCGGVVKAGSCSADQSLYGISWENDGTGRYQTYAWSGTGSVCYSDGASALNKWAFVVSEYNYSSGNIVLYINGVQSTSRNCYSAGTPLYTDNLGFIISEFNGDISNVQVYNTTLSPSDIQTLYAEGIGGVPININRLAAWWPLNGDVNDYSGNGNNGGTGSIVWNANWYTSYTPT